MNILLSVLESVPGLVTSSYYALLYSHRNIDKLITISLSNNISDICEKEIIRELERIEVETGNFIDYERYKSPISSITSVADVYSLRRLVSTILMRNNMLNNRTYVSIASSSSVVAAILSLSAMLCKPELLFDISLACSVEKNGDIIYLLRMSDEEKRRYLKPSKDHISIINVPLLSFGDKIPIGLPFQMRVFIYAVGNYIMTSGDMVYTSIMYNHWPNKSGNRYGNVDIFASRVSEGTLEFLLCMCTLTSNIIDNDYFARLSDKRDTILESMSPSSRNRVKASIVTINSDRENIERANKYGIELYYAHLPSGWRTRADWEIIALEKL